MQQLLRTAALTIAWLMVVPCLIVLISAIVPIVPWLRIYAFNVVPNRTSWFFLWSIAALIVGLLSHSLVQTRLASALAATSAVTVLLTAGVMIHLLYIAESNGARIDLVRALSLRDVDDGAGPDESRIYARPEGEALWLDIYHPHKAKPNVLSPVMVVVHGGGFLAGSRAFGAANSRWYAAHGWTVISVDYRLSRPGRPTWNLATQDVQCALAWIAANAASLGVDINRLTLSGGSAGGTLAMAAAYAANAESSNPKRGTRVPHVAAVIAKVPLIDMVGSWRHPGELRGEQRIYLTSYLGGSPEQYPERYAAADLRRSFGPGDPPTLILGGAEDPLVPPEGATDFARKAEAAGYPVRHILFPYSGHDFNTTYDGITNQALLQIIAQFAIDHDAGPIAPGTQLSSASRRAASRRSVSPRG
ncbi:MAG: alpha/beta hydrolase [Sphingomonas bacterium]